MSLDLKGLWRTPDENYIELVLDEGEIPKNVPIVVEKLESFACTDRLIRTFREGKVIFARLGDFKKTNMEELKRSISKLKTITKASEGTIVAVANDWLIM